MITGKTKSGFVYAIPEKRIFATPITKNRAS